jgi:cation:H+ antiporter
MAIAVLQFVISALVIVAAGTLLTRCADAIAEATKLGRLLVGSVFLAGATSLPELLVDISAVRLGFADLAVGDLMGSSLFNLLILAIGDLMYQSRGKMLSRSAAAHALSATMSVSLTALAGIAIFLGPRIGFTIANVGPGCWMILIAYLLGARLIYFDQRYSAAQLGEPAQTMLVPEGHVSLRKAIVGYLFGAAVIVVAAPYMAEASGELAERTGLGGTFFGTTLVAFCTSLPELVATVVSVRMGAFDLALGNIFGSNAFNMILMVPLDIAFPGSLMAHVSQTHVLTAFATIVVTSLAVLGQLYQVEKRTRFLEPDALAVIVVIFGSLALIYYLR